MITNNHGRIQNRLRRFRSPHQVEVRQENQVQFPHILSKSTSTNDQSWQSHDIGEAKPKQELDSEFSMKDIERSQNHKETWFFVKEQKLEKKRQVNQVHQVSSFPSSGYRRSSGLTSTTSTMQRVWSSCLFEVEFEAVWSWRRPKQTVFVCPKGVEKNQSLPRSTATATPQSRRTRQPQASDFGRCFAGMRHHKNCTSKNESLKFSFFCRHRPWVVSLQFLARYNSGLGFVWRRDWGQRTWQH